LPLTLKRVPFDAYPSSQTHGKQGAEAHLGFSQQSFQPSVEKGDDDEKDDEADDKY